LYYIVCNYMWQTTDYFVKFKIMINSTIREHVFLIL